MNTGSWTAVEASTDLRDQAQRLARIHYDVAAGGKPPDALREPVRNSWARCARAGFDPARDVAPVLLTSEEAAERWRRHPLSIAEPLLRELLADVRSDDAQVVLACDADGALLWIDGEPAVLDAAHEIHLQPGAVWSEPSAGTNAMGTALAAEHPIQIFSAEHLAETVHGWTCSAAPVRDPSSGELLGVIDLSGEVGTAHPHSLALISAAARMVESELRSRAADERQGLGAVARKRGRTDPTVALRIEALGRRRAGVDVGGTRVELSRRHSEIVVLLAMDGEELDHQRLASELYGERGLAVSARAELSRLRRILGERLPRGAHHLAGPVSADFAELERGLDAGSPERALRAYPGPLLPGSQVPLIVEARERLELRLREAALGSGRPELLEYWLRTDSGRDDLEASRDLVRMLGAADPALAGAVSRLRRQSRDGRWRDTGR